MLPLKIFLEKKKNLSLVPSSNRKMLSQFRLCILNIFPQISPTETFYKKFFFFFFLGCCTKSTELSLFSNITYIPTDYLETDYPVYKFSRCLTSFFLQFFLFFKWVNSYATTLRMQLKWSIHFEVQIDHTENIN